jgi:hypothetical protein
MFALSWGIAKLVPFCFTISAHNEHIFSVIWSKWIRERTACVLNQGREFQLHSVISRMCHVNSFMLVYVTCLGFWRKSVQLKNMWWYNLFWTVCCVKSFLTYIRGILKKIIIGKCPFCSSKYGNPNSRLILIHMHIYKWKWQFLSNFVTGKWPLEEGLCFKYVAPIFYLTRIYSRLCHCYIERVLVAKGGYTLVTLPRIVTPYRDSVDGTSARVTYQKLVTR